MSDWISVIHPPREDFAATMTHRDLRVPDEAAARRVIDENPVIAGGLARGDFRPFRVSLLRGRDT